MARTPKGDNVDRTDRYVACSGGPRDGCWYSLAFWQACLTAAELNGETTHYGRTLGYVETDGAIAHPRIDNLTGTVHRWNRDLAATQRRKLNPNP